MNATKFQKSVFAAALVLGAFSPLSHAAELTIEVSNITELKGSVMVALYVNGETWLGKPALGSGAAANAEKVTVKFADVPAGSYAAAVYQDVNGNGKMDSNVMGIPTEPYGFSNNATGRFGPPKFDAAKFLMADTATAIKLDLN
jgi:uncharacterized protein (DUF2141 family)